MATKRKEPRKQPVQARSRIKVDAILAAAPHILKSEGLTRVTTNRIAEAASVSVGSVYQYFPDKESILLTLMRCHLDAARAMRPPVLDRRGGITLPERIEAAVHWHFEVSRRDPEIHRRLYEIHRDILTGARNDPSSTAFTKARWEAVCATTRTRSLREI